MCCVSVCSGLCFGILLGRVFTSVCFLRVLYLGLCHFILCHVVCFACVVLYCVLCSVLFGCVVC